jgi:hypothetical protein
MVFYRNLPPPSRVEKFLGSYSKIYWVNTGVCITVKHNILLTMSSEHDSKYHQALKYMIQKVVF